MRKNTVKVIIVDDNRIYRKGLKSIINRKAGFQVTGEAEGVQELSLALENYKTDVIIISVFIGASEQERIFSLLRNRNQFPFICFGLNNTQAGILGCIRNGASGILKKENSTDHLFEAIKTVIKGDQYFNGPVSRITSKIIQHAHNEHYNSHDFSGLSEREIEVLKLFANGFTYKEIGEKLFISPRTVETHKNNILSKLNLVTLVDLVKYAIVHELIEI